jgi:signal transduction histidine kinase/ActR/RegA family two-component response regulator
MASPSSQTHSPIPNRILGFHYTCLLALQGEYVFKAPAEDIEQMLELSAFDLSNFLTHAQFPSLNHIGSQLRESFRKSSEHLRPWFQDIQFIGSRTGREIWVRACGVPNREDDGAVKWSGVVLDVTDLKTQEHELRSLVDRLARSEAWMRAALDGARMLGWDLDLETNRWETTVNIPEFYGVPSGPDYKDPEIALSAVHPDDLPHVLAGRRRAMETGELMQYEFRGSVATFDGFPRWYTTRGQVLRNEFGKPVRLVAVTTDVTERKRAEAERETLNRQLLDAQKWESLGVLAGGVAHDFNNILTVVLGNAGLARKGLPPFNPAGAYLEQIEQACRRAADLCRQLLAYAGRGQIATGTTELNQLIQNSAALLEIPTSKAATIRFELDKEIPTITGDPAQVRQVLVNLVMNAAEAIGNAPGEILIKTQCVEVPVESLIGYQLAPLAGWYVSLTVSDTGPGIGPEILTKVFDPFFSTKFAGRGLGLAAVLGIMRTHRGAIRVLTDATKGTKVEVLWPVASNLSSIPLAEQPRTKPLPIQKALIVDDEMFVREVTASTLEELGYEALLAGDGPTALDLFCKHQNEVRLAVIDVVMPGMTGDQLLDELRARSRTLPAVLVSGFTDRRVIKSGSEESTQFLQKPFHPEELIAMVKRVTRTNTNTE